MFHISENAMREPYSVLARVRSDTTRCHSERSEESLPDPKTKRFFVASLLRMTARGRVSGWTPAGGSVSKGLRNPIGDSAGFTLIEIVMIIILVGILVVVAAPKFLATGGFSLEGAVAMVAADLRHAQELAMASHTNTSVSFTAGDTDYTVDWQSDKVDLPGDVSIDSVSGNPFTFNPLGEPISGGGGSVTLIAGGGGGPTRIISVENYTGQVTVP